APVPDGGVGRDVSAKDVDPGARARAGRRLARLGVGQILGLSIGVLLAIAAVSLALAFVAGVKQGDRRRELVDSIDPALPLAVGLGNTLVNQETGVRGYALSGERRFLEPYRAGKLAEAQTYRELAAIRPGGTTLRADVAAVRARANAWRSRFADPTIART